jgi:CRISPR-associated protein Cas1
MTLLIKFDTVVPVAFKIAASKPPKADQAVRIACRDEFRKSKVLDKLIPMIEEILAAAEVEPPQMPADAQPPAIPEPESIGDEGHRSQ